MFFTLFGYWVQVGGVSQGIGTQPAYAVAAVTIPPAGSTAALAEGHQVGGGHAPRAPPPPTRSGRRSRGELL